MYGAMVFIPSKRQQARNEKALQELIYAIPGNDRCADCQARNPGWASWNLGVFLCMRCAALHRKMGTHISKVKSLSMDSWTSAQVDNMRKNGNAIVNTIYNPRNVRPPVPVDIEEIDSAMERFIRQKYEHQVLEDGKPKPPSREDPGYRTKKSLDDPPPPLPPKSNKIFGFTLGSVSSASRLSPTSEKQSTPSSLSPRSDSFGSLSPPLTTNKRSRSFASSLGEGSFESKLITLREMGFPDDKRNATILKELNGNLDRTVESLIRLGEGSTPGSRSRTPVRSGISSQKSTTSTTPFDQLGSMATSKGESTSTVGLSLSPVKPYNPFDMPTSQPATSSGPSLEGSFRHLQVSQPLFPNSTGGYPSQQGQPLQVPYPQSMTPPVALPSVQKNFAESSQALNGNVNRNLNPFLPTPSPGGSGGPMNTYYPIQQQNFSPRNPFFSHSSSQPGLVESPLQLYPSVSGINVSGAQYQTGQHINTTPSFSTSFFQPQTQQQEAPPPVSYKPTIMNMNQSIPSYQTQMQPSVLTSRSVHQPLSQYANPRAPSRMDKNSILALYSLSQPLTTSAPENSQQTQPQSTYFPSIFDAGLAPSTLPSSLGSTPQTQLAFNLSPPQRSVTMPVDLAAPPAGTHNPFISPPPPAGQQSAAASIANSSRLEMGTEAKVSQSRSFLPRIHMSQASVDISGLQNGRHSPDAFASLSARYAT